ncbi:MAG: RadC family protein [Proteobacteria bacterium]|nr:RadC family protein [Pseudomonadota bacterium]
MATGTAAGHRGRLRERFSKNRLNGFHDYEVVELLLTYAIARRDVKPLAKSLLSRFGTLCKLFEATRGELMEVDGVGENAATLLTLLKPLTKEYLGARPEMRQKVSSAEDAVAAAKNIAPATGSVSTLYLNTKNEVLYVEEAATAYGQAGSITPKAIIESAIERNAKSIIFVRTLSKNAKVPKRPEEEELAAVKAVATAAGTLDIAVHDYIITSDEEHLSAREKGFL